MEYNEYATQVLIKQRHAELMASAHREAVARAARSERARRRSLRVALGTGLIRWGAWLLRGRYPSTSLP
ncbi:MAG: hypothetical protein AUI04_11730 [Candidatus Rokubacteria bacterium 13_2_20CM_2_64_8]|nr:MAG: hypothetical protein AUH18_07505 [Candidatus Rokubacteria bacterium 13_2_20CM_69_10]OLB39643.1 MAG: hypothetical protein AUI04_11730 [Candidatus Rokubacteria bacterium 13_2_20CM_2_64_8]OLC63423.1 MAG: hypothetical protein AUH76_06380 [Candidatus Rokubacteria bacterium 13_1_40CM_4_67_11]OLD94590.1 MAG: hypothetical protein AUG80_18360 [Candidatus Rokubacteria bacterium 13_1_20CM_4_68_9]PYN61542.1 MAG: hypothetical protein DMD90_23065 [Candidatus Rokubacteria bacterium]